jgi:hypothetical protein
MQTVYKITTGEKEFLSVYLWEIIILDINNILGRDNIDE